MEKLFVGVSVSLCLIVIVLHTITLYEPEPYRMKVYDCVIGWSGGKDSSAVALMLKKELGLNPLLVTFSPLIPTVEGEFNRRSLQFHGFDSILISPNLKISRYLSRRFLTERGDPKIHWNAGVNAATINIAGALS